MFWTHHPSLPYAICLALGIRMGLGPHPAFFIPLLALLQVPKKRLLLALLVGVAGYVFALTQYHFPPDHENRWEGTGTLEITSLKKGTSYKQEAWIYKGVFHDFGAFRGIPVGFILLDKGGFRPVAGVLYDVQGVIKRSKNGFQLKAESWEAAGTNPNLIELRAAWKEKAAVWIAENIPHPRSAHLLTGLLTGDFDDKLLTFDFSRFGLQHLMAISGFHFTVIASLLSVILGLFFPKKQLLIVLSISMTLYFFFLGPSPSIVRAWLSSMVVFFAGLLGKESRGLNTLGLSFIVVLLLNPLAVFSIGCLFSFGVTAAILLFFEDVDAFLKKILIPRKFVKVQNMPYLHQIAIVILTFFRQSLALNIAVTFIALPMTLYFFHQFPFLSLFYNLFFPFLVSFSMLLLLLALLTAWFSPLSHLIHLINSYYTDFILNLTHELPHSWDLTWTLSDFPLLLFIFIITIIYSLPLHKNRIREYN